MRLYIATYLIAVPGGTRIDAQLLTANCVPHTVEVSPSMMADAG